MTAIKFLVVDDATFIRDLVKKNLRNYFPDCQILDAPSAKKAQVMLKTNRVDLILCDWEMPEMTGEEFLRWIRASESLADLPFIMVTSRGERDFIVKAVQAGVSDYLGKPFTPEQLVGKVKKALAKVGKNQQPTVAPEASNSSLNILTGNKEPSKPVPAAKTASSDSVSLLTGGSAPTAKANTPTKKQAKNAVRGQAQLNFVNFSTQCIIKDISLQSFSGAIKREDNVPCVLETVVISIVQNNGEDVARLNGYVHSVQAAENRIDAGVLKLVIRFVDDDPEKLEQLSRYIAKL